MNNQMWHPGTEPPDTDERIIFIRNGEYEIGWWFQHVRRYVHAAALYAPGEVSHWCVCPKMNNDKEPQNELHGK